MNENHTCTYHKSNLFTEQLFTDWLIASDSHTLASKRTTAMHELCCKNPWVKSNTVEDRNKVHIADAANAVQYAKKEESKQQWCTPSEIFKLFLVLPLRMLLLVFFRCSITLCLQIMTSTVYLFPSSNLISQLSVSRFLAVHFRNWINLFTCQSNFFWELAVKGDYCFILLTL